MPRTTVTKQRSAKVHETEAQRAKKAQDKGVELRDEMDALLDEIDGVLEENASDVLASYRQLSGE